MQSTNSSGFQKDFNSTHAYQCDNVQFAETSFGFVQNFDEFDLEQSCLIRLKAQRQKIEQLTKLYQHNEKELIQQAENQKKLEEEIERLTDMSEYKQSYIQLKKEFDALTKKNEMNQYQCEELKKQLDGMAAASSEEIEALKLLVKYEKEQRVLSDSHWQAILADKQQLLKKQSRHAQEKEYELCEKIKVLEQVMETLRQTIKEHEAEFEDHKQYFEKEISVREEDLLNFEKVVESFKKQNSQYKARLAQLENDFEKERSQYTEVIDQLKHQLKLFKQNQSEKENQIYEYKEMIKKCDAKNQNLESTVTTLKANLKKIKVNTDSNIKKLTTETESERGKLELFVDELKAQIEKQMQEKSVLVTEVKKLRGFIERKQQQQKQRKLLLMSEFREIDKMEKVVKKIL